VGLAEQEYEKIIEKVRTMEQLCASGHHSHCCPHCHDPDHLCEAAEMDNALEQIGTGSQDHCHLSVRRHLPPMAKAKQNACLHRQGLCEEIIRNKFFPNCNHSCFIHIVSFELTLTSYMDVLQNYHNEHLVEFSFRHRIIMTNI
jgi:hypothetical protein